MLALHGWPQHHWVYRDLLADPPPGLRIIAPDLPGYGWSGPAPHKWAKDDVAADVLALMDALGLDRVLLVGHDWGGWVAHLMVLAAPERFDGLLVLNMAHPWQTYRTVVPHLWRFLAYQPLMATGGGAAKSPHAVLAEADLRHRPQVASGRACRRAHLRRPLPRPRRRAYGQGHLPHLPASRNTLEGKESGEASG